MQDIIIFLILHALVKRQGQLLLSSSMDYSACKIVTWSHCYWPPYQGLVMCPSEHDDLYDHASASA